VFDVGFTELMVIAVVALIVIGPERLPRVARTLGHLFGRLQRYVNDVKADINREIELEELKKFKSTFVDAARGFESTVNTEINAVQSEAAKTQNELSSELNSLAKIEEPAAAPPPAPGPASGEASLTPGEIGLEPRSEAPAKPEKTTA
jgi:sec-independent protein translocase protein TatB